MTSLQWTFSFFNLNMKHARWLKIPICMKDKALAQTLNRVLWTPAFNELCHEFYVMIKLSKLFD